MKRIAIIIAAALLVCTGARAKVVLPSIFTDNMVLQQGRDVNLWGTATPNGKITVQPSWSKYRFTTETASDGSWFLYLPTPAAGGPYSITFSDGGKEKTVLKNVLIGEVWFCSGQSNMEMPVRGFHGQPVEGSADAILGAKPSVPIRICTVQRQCSASEEKTCKCQWKEHNPESVAEASAVAYFFARRLNEVLDVPVGLIITDWGGTPIEAWMNRETLRLEFKGEFDFSHMDSRILPKKYPQNSPCAMFNGQVAPLVPFTFRGMLWYQGESNRGRAEQYIRLQTSYVRMMRYLFRNENAPFYFVQIAPYNYSDSDLNSPLFYEAQEATLSTIPRSGMVGTADIGEWGTIHPRKKKEVGDRLAMLALQDEYGLNYIDAHSPSYAEAEFKDGKAVVTMNVGDLNLAPIDVDLEGFELAGEDRVFHPATGRVRGKTVIVSSPEVPEPVAVRYCFHNWSVGTLFNSYGIPAYPFRSDDWK